MAISFDEAKRKICERVVDKMDFSKEMSEDEVYEAIDDAILELGERSSFSVKEIIQLRSESFNSLRKYDAIQEFLEDPSVTEVMVNGMDGIFIERNGTLAKTEKSFESKEKLEDVIQQMVAGCNRTVNEASPIVDARLFGEVNNNIR